MSKWAKISKNADAPNVSKTQPVLLYTLSEAIDYKDNLFGDLYYISQIYQICPSGIAGFVRVPTWEAFGHETHWLVMYIGEAEVLENRDALLQKAKNNNINGTEKLMDSGYTMNVELLNGEMVCTNFEKDADLAKAQLQDAPVPVEFELDDLCYLYGVLTGMHANYYKDAPGYKQLTNVLKVVADAYHAVFAETEDC